MPDIRWTLWITWRDRDGREWASGEMRYATLEQVRKAHTDQVIEHKHGHTDRTHVLVHQPAKHERSSEGKWSPAGWDAGVGTFEIRWPESKPKAA